METRCNRCGRPIVPEDTYTWGGDQLCEDCYLDRVATPKTCDPWAVYTATRTMHHHGSLTPIQQRIYDFIKAHGPSSEEEICRTLSLSATDFRTAFSTMRHMELLRASKVNDHIEYRLFHD